MLNASNEKKEKAHKNGQWALMDVPRCPDNHS